MRQPITTLEGLVERAIELLGRDTTFHFDIHAAAHVLAQGDDFARVALRRVPRHRRLRITKVVDALSLIHVGAPAARVFERYDWLTPFAEGACDTALAVAASNAPERDRGTAASIVVSVWSAVRPTAKRNLAVAAAARRNLDQPCAGQFIDVLGRRVATDDLVYGAIVEIAARLAVEPHQGRGSLSATFHALRLAPRRVLPLGWFLAYGDHERSRTTAPCAVRCARDIITGLVDAGGNEPVKVARWRDENAAWLALSAAHPSHNWPVQLVRS
jgi:hypothetical protein